jgi:hypothetical protein
MADIAAAFERVTGIPLAGPRPRRHPDAVEAEEREMERAERDRDFLRVYGDGR